VGRVLPLCLKGYVVKLDKFSKYAPVLKDSVAYAENSKRADIPHER